MRPGPSDRQAAGNLRRGVRVSSWLGTTCLALEVPATDAVLEESDSQQVPEKLTLTVPVDARGGSWDPTDDTTHPLATYGQRLNVVSTWGTPRGSGGESPIGWFLLDSWKLNESESAVSVEALGLLQVVAEDTFPAPEAPRPGGTFASEVRRLAGALPVSIDPALVDRACPRSFSWDEDRLDALYDLADAWPARLGVTAEGAIAVTPPLGLTPSPVLTLTDGRDGVIITMPRSDSRDGRYNAVAAHSSSDTATSKPVSGTFATTDGPFAVATYGTVRKRYSSPLLGTASAARAAARTIAEDSQRQARVFTVRMPPDSRIQRGDALTLRWRGRRYDGWVQDVSLPLLPGGGAAVLKVGCPQ